MSVDERLDALRNKHASLKEAIDVENQRPRPDDIRISALKREKLRIKDEIVGLEAGH